MAVLRAADRQALSDVDFALPHRRLLPIHDRSHALVAYRVLDRMEGLPQAEVESARTTITSRLRTLGLVPKQAAPEAGSAITNMPLQHLSAAASFVDYELPPREALSVMDEVVVLVGQAVLDSLKTLKTFEKVPASVWLCFSDGAEVVDAEDSEDRLLRLPIARLGTFVSAKYGLVTFSQDDFDEIQENFLANEAGFVPYLRYGHAKRPEAKDGEPKIADLLSLEQVDDVLWGYFKPLPNHLDVLDEVETGEYAHGSAELFRGWISKIDGREVGTLLTAHALTNAPFVPGLPYNQVFSDNADGGDQEMALFLSCKGDASMNPTPDQVLSMIEKELGETLSISSEKRQQLIEKLSAGGFEPVTGAAEAGTTVEVKEELPAPAEDPASDVPVGDVTEVPSETLSTKGEADGHEMADDKHQANKPDAGDSAEAIDALGGNRMERGKGGAGDEHTPEQNSTGCGPSMKEKNSMSCGCTDVCTCEKNAMSCGCVGTCSCEKYTNDPLSQAAEKLSQMAEGADDEAKEKLSFLGQFLSGAGKFFGFGKKPEGKEKESYSAGVSDPVDPQNHDQILSQEAGTVELNPSELIPQGGDEMSLSEAQIKELMSTAIAEAVAPIKQEFSTALSEKDATIAGLTEKLAGAETKLTETAGVAQQFSNSLADSAFNARRAGLIAAGIPPAMVNDVAAIAKNLRGQKQELSNGDTVDTAEALFRALEKLPGENRLSYGQVGHQELSNDTDPNPYADIIATARAASGK